MAERPRQLDVSLSDRAVAALDEISIWTADKFGLKQAEPYDEFLTSEIARLGSLYDQAIPVPGRRLLKYRVAKLRPSGHGHLIVFLVLPETVQVVDIFHTAQNWQKRFKRLGQL